MSLNLFDNDKSHCLCQGKGTFLDAVTPCTLVVASWETIAKLFVVTNQTAHSFQWPDLQLSLYQLSHTVTGSVNLRNVGNLSREAGSWNCHFVSVARHNHNDNRHIDTCRRRLSISKNPQGLTLFEPWIVHDRLQLAQSSDQPTGNLTSQSQTAMFHLFGLV